MAVVAPTAVHTIYGAFTPEVYRGGSFGLGGQELLEEPVVLELEVEPDDVVDATERGGDLEVILPTKQLVWVARLVLRLGGEATVLDPPELSSLVRETAERTLALYG